MKAPLKAEKLETYSDPCNVIVSINICWVHRAVVAAHIDWLPLVPLGDLEFRHFLSKL